MLVLSFKLICWKVSYLKEDSNTEDSNKKDSEKFFCSELVARALRDGGLIDDIDPKTVTPIKLLRQFDIYAEHYVQFKGKSRKRSVGFKKFSGI